jgi:hypothetical protein
MVNAGHDICDWRSFKKYEGFIAFANGDTLLESTFCFPLLKYFFTDIG